jgi:hypothetical protein
MSRISTRSQALPGTALSRSSASTRATGSGASGKFRPRRSLGTSDVVLAVLLFLVGNASAADRAQEEFFETKIRPVLIERCFKCHGSAKVGGELRVDSRASLLKGGESGAAVVPGKPDESLLFQAISPAFEDVQMPPDDPLPASVVADFRQWIEQNAVWPDVPDGVSDPAFQKQDHWAFRPIVEVAVPELPAESGPTEWLKSPVDRFVLQQQIAEKLSPSPRADRATLIRRLKFDLLGLPPTFEESQEFINDAAPDAWPKLVDRFLSSKHYGERWGRHWLDVARYADTKGYVFQEERKYPFAYTYRDWVVRSLNDDLPYDEFLIRQLAADWRTKDGVPESELAAMGFLTLGRRFLNNTHDIIDDRIDVVTRGLMGVTVTCARCHDHKYDPIPQADYYSLYGVFASSTEPKDAQNAMPLLESDKPFNPYIFLRGQAGNHGPQVKRQFLEIVAGPDRQPFKNGSGRLELAQAIASRDNPLTARVLVNRVWQQHFHSPLVNTPSDFGLRCDPPTHPELMDWLAWSFIESGWSLKSLHRSMLLSETYQQASIDVPAKREIDSENRLLWRMNRSRLELEAMRDAMLAVSGDFDETIGGPAVEIATDPSPRRRTIYGFIDRQNLPGLFRTFDFAGPDAHSPGRFVTSVPQQTLYLRNSPFVTGEARRVAERLPASSDELRIQSLFRTVLSRDPGEAETKRALTFVRDDSGATAGTPLWQYGYGRFNPDTGQLDSFTHLPHFNGTGWQGGEALPDPKTGWTSYRAGGGHPGDQHHSVVLRWTAPRDVTVRVTGQLKHPSDKGNGVRARVVAVGRGLVAEWSAANRTVQTTSPEIAITAGQTVDLIIDDVGDTSFDSFNWAPELRDVSNPSAVWNSQTQFHGPAPKPLDTWAMLAQVLLLSNEFQFVD